MAKRISEFTQSLKQLGEIQVTDWDFMDLINKEIDFGSSLRKLGNVKVIKWDFSSVMPNVHRIAHKEVEFPEVVVRAANFKVLDWDFRSPERKALKPKRQAAANKKPRLSPLEMQDLMDRMRLFIQFIVVNLISEPDRAEIRIQEIDSGVLRFRLLVMQKDVKDMIGRDGATAAAVRGMLKATAAKEGVTALLEVLSHEEEQARVRREGVSH